MKGGPARAVASSAEHGRHPADPDDPRFQGPGEPHPRHWRTFPVPWPDGFTDDPAVRERMAEAVRALPPRWRAVLVARDGYGRPAEQVAAELDLTLAEQRRLLNQARAAVRAELAATYESGVGR